MDSQKHGAFMALMYDSIILVWMMNTLKHMGNLNEKCIDKRVHKFSKLCLISPSGPRSYMVHF